MRNTLLYLGFGAAFGLLIGSAFYWEAYWVLLLPFILALIYFGLYYPGQLLLSLAFFAPLSVNIEEHFENFGLFIPTEPVLFGLMIILLFTHLRKPILTGGFHKNPLVMIVLIYLSWLFICSLTSSHPVISFKAILAKLWYVIPIFVFGDVLFDSDKKIRLFFWFLTIGTCWVIIYTIYNHSLYGFGEKESHWVMSPFYKDHTIYGAAVAIVVPFPVLLYLTQDKPTPLWSFILGILFLIILLGLYFSYTRAAWLSVFGAALILLSVMMRIKFRYLALAGLVAGGILFLYYDTIQMELARNKTEHTTEAFDERIQSAANVTTDASNLERINRWSCAIEMFKERPIFGFGPGTYAFEYAPFQEPENLTIISTNFGDMGNAHSEYLSALSETGAIGLLLFLVMIIVLFYQLVKLITTFKANNKRYYIITCGILFSLSTYFIHAFLNNFLDTDKAAIPVFGMMAIVIVLNKKALFAQPEGGI